MKRILKFLCPLLFALGILFSPFFTSHAFAAEKTEITSSLKSTIREFIDGEITFQVNHGINNFSGYVVFWDSNGNLCVALLTAPDYSGFYLDANNKSYVQFYYDYGQSILCSLFYYQSSQKSFVRYNDMGGVAKLLGYSGSLWSVDKLSDSIAYSNFDFKDQDGKVFFVLRSLAVPHLLRTIEGAKLQVTVMETAKVIALIAVSSVLLYLVLVRFVGKSLTLLVK